MRQVVDSLGRTRDVELLTFGGLMIVVTPADGDALQFGVAFEVRAIAALSYEYGLVVVDQAECDLCAGRPSGPLIVATRISNCATALWCQWLCYGWKNATPAGCVKTMLPAESSTS